VPLAQIPAAEKALREAAAGLPAALCERLQTDQKLADEDRAAIIAIAARALERFQAAAVVPAALPAVGAGVEGSKR
jgi:F-type H+-transporting ATPase subunit alpha